MKIWDLNCHLDETGSEGLNASGNNLCTILFKKLLRLMYFSSLSISGVLSAIGTLWLPFSDICMIFTSYYPKRSTHTSERKERDLGMQIRLSNNISSQNRAMFLLKKLANICDLTLSNLLSVDCRRMSQTRKLGLRTRDFCT